MLVLSHRQSAWGSSLECEQEGRGQGGSQSRLCYIFLGRKAACGAHDGHRGTMGWQGKAKEFCLYSRSQEFGERKHQNPKLYFH